MSRSSSWFRIPDFQSGWMGSNPIRDAKYAYSSMDRILVYETGDGSSSLSRRAKLIKE